MSRRLQYALAGLLIVAGAVLLTRPWWTGLVESGGQRQLAAEYARAAAQPAPAAAPSQPAAAPDTKPQPEPAPGPWHPPGSPPPVYARLSIPAIGVQDYVGDGATLTDYYNVLEWGPGHIVGTPQPGGVGNAVVIGHRDEFGDPFWNLYKLQPGDQVRLQAHGRTFDYTVRRVWMVYPSDVGVVAPIAGARDLTLLTCGGPANSERVVVRAALPSPPAAATAPAQGVARTTTRQAATVTSSTYGRPTTGTAAVPQLPAAPAPAGAKQTQPPPKAATPPGAAAVAPPAPKT